MKIIGEYSSNIRVNIYINLMDFTQGSLMNILPQKWGEITCQIEEAKKTGKNQILLHKQYFPLDSCHKEMRDKLNRWLQDKDKDLYAKIYDDRFQGCFIATNPEVFLAWS